VFQYRKLLLIRKHQGDRQVRIAPLLGCAKASGLFYAKEEPSRSGTQWLADDIRKLLIRGRIVNAAPYAARDRNKGTLSS